MVKVNEEWYFTGEVHIDSDGIEPKQSIGLYKKNERRLRRPFEPVKKPDTFRIACRYVRNSALGLPLLFRSSELAVR